MLLINKVFFIICINRLLEEECIGLPCGTLYKEGNGWFKT